MFQNPDIAQNLSEVPFALFFIMFDEKSEDQKKNQDFWVVIYDTSKLIFSTKTVTQKNTKIKKSKKKMNCK